MNQAIIQFEQIDSWFFRESRPHGSVGANALNSVFPPPTRTLMGAVRSHLGQHYFANHPNHTWDDLDRLPQLQAVIGNAEQLGSLQPRGVFLQQITDNQVSYYLPAPSNLCSKAEQGKDYYLAFELSKKLYQTDIGTIYLPTLPEQVTGLVDSRGFKPLENAWISTQVWQAILNANMTDVAKLSAQICQVDEFMSSEYRLGIALQSDFSQDNVRNVKEGQLYQTTHLRLKPNVSIFMPVQYDDSDLQQFNSNWQDDPAILRLGGEARMASMQVHEYTDSYLPKAPSNLTQQVDNGKKRFMLYFISKLSMKQGWLPKGFTQNSVHNGFIGTINGIDMTIVSACMGKAYREGGWNQLEHKPRAIENYLPVGTALFVDVDNSVSDNAIIQALHGKSYLDNAWGEGLMLVGKPIQN